MLSLNRRYAVEGYPGKQFYTLGWCMVWIPDDEYGEEGSWIPDPSSRQVIMVPFDEEKEYYVDIDDIYEINLDGTRKLPEACVF